MDVLSRAAGFERVVYASDDRAGLRCIIAIHSTRLGPALGGCRIRAYESEDAALTDVVRLAEGMTYKAAASGLDLGGGKSVIIADPQRDKTELLLRAFGRVVESLGGRYITSVDVGSAVTDLDVMRRETEFVVGVSPFHGGSGDPSPITARGVAHGIRACVYHLSRNPSLNGKRVGIQGVGKVGYHLAGILAAEGAEVVVADPSLDRVGKCVSDFSVGTTTPDEILELECDVLAPCALGAVLNSDTIPRLKCPIVCGASNNQLATDEDAESLARAGILYAPDFIVNAGGLISVADELVGWNRDRVVDQVDRIGRTLLDVLHLAQEHDVTPAEAAVVYARRRIEAVRSLCP